MRVLMLVSELTVGGLPNLVLELSRALKASGDTVVLAHASPTVPAHLDLRDVALLDLAAPAHGVPASPAERIRQWQPDVIHVHLCSDVPLLRALRGLGVPLLRTFHDYSSVCLRRGRRRFPGDRCQRALGWPCLLQGCAVGAPRPGSTLIHLESLPRKWAEREAYRQFDAHIAVSHNMRRTLLTNGFEPQRVSVVPNFSRFDEQAQGRMPLPPKPTGVAGATRPLQWLFAGQAVAGKGLTVLVRALSGLPGAWHLTAVTAGPDVPKAQAMAERMGLNERISFIDWLPQAALASLYRQSDALVVPSVWDDPAPLVGIEAMSMETPVLAFPVGGLPDYVIDGQTGWLTDEVSVPALHTGLRRVLAAGAQLPLMGRQAREWVAQHHSRVAHLGRVRALYLHAGATPDAFEDPAQLATRQEARA